MKQSQDQQEKPMKYIQVKHVFISSPSGDWNFFDFIINKNVATYIQSTSEKSDHEVRMHIPPSDTLRKQCLSMKA